MIPLQDDIPSRTVPFVNYALILVSCVVFALQVSEGPGSSLVERFGMVPARVIDPEAELSVTQQVQRQTPWGIEVIDQDRPMEPAGVAPWMTLLTCIFLHGGWMHIIGNMWFLFIFGDNVEDRIGHVGYLLFYLLCGAGASATHLLIGPDSSIPTIGASGAIAGVMGAYFVFYPKAKVHAVIPIFIILQMIVLPAPVFLGIWFAFQFYQGTFGGAAGGVAWWAHIGGFAIGLGIALLMKFSNLANPPVEKQKDFTPQLGGYRSPMRRNRFRNIE